MKFLKSNFAKKLIIILIAVMILNIGLPHKVNAGLVSDIVDMGGGIFLKPITALIVTVLVTVDITLGLVLTGFSFALDGIGAIVELCQGNGSDSLESVDGMLSKIFIGPDTIFSGTVEMLNANIFKTTSITGNGQAEFSTWINGLLGIGSSSSNAQPGASIVNTAKKVVSQVYVALRNICGFVMLGALIFTGIRILLSSNIPTKKSLYLTYLQDWLIGFVLLIFSHILMIGIFYISDTITEALKFGTSNFGGMNYNLTINALMSLKATKQIVLTILLGYLIWLTLVFAIAYFKRFMWVCVLTVFAPVFSVMYAFGQQTKQIYSRWIREYMLTVFVQPFHMIIYTVLVQIPIQAVSGFTWDVNNNLLTMIYALIAISFIRPAEKWMRGMFGMDKGIANMASYDSGKQTYDAAKNAYDEMAMKIRKAAAVVATGIAAGGGLGAATGALGETGAIGSSLTESAQGLNDLIGQGNSALNNYLNDGFGQNSLGEFLNPYTDEYDPNYNPLNDPNYNQIGTEDVDDFSESDIRALTDGINEGQQNNASGNVLSASNVTIQTSSLDIQGLNNSGSQTNNGPIESIAEGTVMENPQIDNADISQGSENALGEGDFSFEQGQGEEGNKKKGLFSNLRTFSGLMSGSGSISDVVDEIASNRLLKSKPVSAMYSFADKGLESMADSKLGWVRKIGEGGSSVRDFVKNGGIKALEANGGLMSAYKGLNSIRDTMFVDGSAPQDWKNNLQRMEESKKKRDEKAVFNFTNNPQNKEYVSQKLMEEAKKKNFNNPDEEKKYVNNNLDSRLKSLAETYAAHYGVTSAAKAYELRDEGKKLGLTPQEVILNRAGFERFNTNSSNTTTLNNTYNVNANNVSQVIPDAREYYNNGYRNIQHMMDAQHIKDTLRTTTDMAMKLENVLRNTGKVNYNGTDKAVQSKIDEINKYYEKRLKGGK